MADFCVYLLLLMKPGVEAFQLTAEPRDWSDWQGPSLPGLAIHLVWRISQADNARPLWAWRKIFRTTTGITLLNVELMRDEAGVPLRRA